MRKGNKVRLRRGKRGKLRRGWDRQLFDYRDPKTTKSSKREEKGRRI